MWVTPNTNTIVNLDVLTQIKVEPIDNSRRWSINGYEYGSKEIELANFPDRDTAMSAFKGLKNFFDSIDLADQ